MLNDEEIKRLFERIEQAYAKTGLRPIRRDWYEMRPYPCACPLGVVLLEAGLPPEDLSCEAVSDILDLPQFFVHGFIRGYDGFFSRGENDEVFLQGFRAGLEAYQRFPSHIAHTVTWIPPGHTPGATS